MTQAPILVHEILSWYFTYNLILFIFSIVLLTVGNYTWYRLGKWILIKDHDYIPVVLVPITVGNLAALTLFNLDWLKIWLAPRLWLIEYTANLVKQQTH